MELEIDYQFKSLNTDEEDDTEAQQCVKNIIKNAGYIKYSIDKEVFVGDGGSFLGILYEVNIKGDTEYEQMEHNLFLKTITPGEQMTILSLSDLYKRELFFYCELSKVFEDLQDEVHIPQKERYKTLRCYEESTANVIILDNMKKKGFTTIYRMDTISLQYAESAVKELAKFHALSFALEDRRPKYYDRKIRTITQPFTFNHDMKEMLNSMCLVAINYLDDLGQKKVKDFTPTFMQKLEKHLTQKSGRDVLCHGDFRPSNILMREENGEVKELIPIDYQIIYYGCPVMDFMYLIFLVTDQPFRKSHLTKLKEHYYDNLGIFLKHFDLDVSKVYPKEEFEIHFKERLEYGFLFALYMLPFILSREDDVPEFTGDLASINFKVDARYKDRICDLISDFIESGYL